MGRKRKNTKSSDSISQWKSMSIECKEGLSQEDFEGLVGIEELAEYQITNSKIAKGFDEKEVDSGPPKAKKKKTKKTDAGKKTKKATDKLVKASNQFEVEEISKEPRQTEEDLDMSKWEELSVPKSIIRCLSSMNMASPTPIQTATIKEAIVNRVNVYGAAPTGSGKTLAFGIPLLVHIIKDKEEEVKEGNLVQKVRAIVLTPTRELAVQIKKHIESISEHSPVKVALIVGGLAIQKQQRILQRMKPDILVATPGRLWEIITSGTVAYLSTDSISSLRYLVIDEADRMVEKSHFCELRELVNLWLSVEDQTIWKSRQVFIFSATLTLQKVYKKKKKAKKNEEDSQDLIQLLRLDVSTLKVADLTDGGKHSTPSSDQLQESIINCMKDEKDLYLYYFVSLNPGRTIVFCNSIDCIRRLTNIARFLKLNPLAVNSSMPQKRRLQNIERFTANKNALMFATDVAARGLDIPSVNHVVHYQVPRTAEIYIHRSGRTARVANKGLSLIICDPQEEAFFLKDFCKILNKSNLAQFPINSSILRMVKDRIKLAQQCDQLEHQLRKEQTTDNWFKTTAKACEILTDSSGDESDTDTSSLAKATYYKNRRKLQAFQQQLETLLRQSLVYRNR